MNTHFLRRPACWAAAVLALAGLAALKGALPVAAAASPSASPAGAAPEWRLVRSQPRLPPALARDLQLATLDGAQCWADGLCRFAGCSTPDPDCGNLPTVVSLSVSRHTSVSVTDAEVDLILEEASEVLQVNNGGGDDVPCDVVFLRSGAVTSFSTGDGTVDSQAEYNTAIALAGRVKVVADITWCSGFGAFAGCAPSPGSSQLVVLQGLPHLDGIIWAHEYGHTQGLGHRSPASDRYVMNSWVAGRSTRVNTTECNAFR